MMDQNTEDNELVDVQGYDNFEVTLGDMIRGERATLGKSLEDVEQDLKLRVEILLGIENSDLSAFPSPSFIAGYVRSYAKHLGLDPDACFEIFCKESGFIGLSETISPKRKSSKPVVKPSIHMDDPIVNARLRNKPAPIGVIQSGSVSGVASILVLLLIIAGLGWGGFKVLQEVQRVQFAPVNETPRVASLDAGFGQLESASGIETGEEGIAALQDRRLDDLYRPKELDVPVLTHRDGPISGIDTESFGAFVTAVDQSEELPQELAQPRATEIGPPTVDVVALKPAWIRVFKDDSSILFEKILDAGQRYRLPQSEADAFLRAGNAGFVYVMVGDEIYGPVGEGTSVARKVALESGAVKEAYEKAQFARDTTLSEPVNLAATAVSE